MQKITPCLWFDGKAEEAAYFYTTVFKNSKIGTVSRSGDKVVVATFQIEGQDFMGLNGGPQHKFSEAISFVVNCDTQEEIDRLWDALTQGGQPSQCGWLKDQFGVSWQIVPTVLAKLMGGPIAERSQRVMQALLKMTKLEIAELQQAYDSVP